ncbi:MULTISPECIES: hypothetical protein [unclassified Amycolatopsis]|uniref:hypothetical protein n=1 Tax=unclassified Amycolatopsis TaxID=2618356 RepID=UPI00106DF621|nr:MULTISPECIES: hypothetical protein [unclassified Amycolatopsis]
MTTADDLAAPLQLLVGREISAVCFVRDYVELHFDGPVLRALTNPFGLYGCRGWRFPEGQSPVVMLSYIGTVIDHCELVPDRYLAVDSGEHRFAIPLDEDSRTGPEAAHLVGIDESGWTDSRQLWIW